MQPSWVGGAGFGERQFLRATMRKARNRPWHLTVPHPKKDLGKGLVQRIRILAAFWLKTPRVSAGIARPIWSTFGCARIIAATDTTHPGEFQDPGGRCSGSRGSN